MFLNTLRLYDEEECKSFFTKINSKEYQESLKTNPIQYIIKIGRAAHASTGIFLLDSQQESELKAKYEQNGKNCGHIKDSLLAQTYLNNPLLVNIDKKIDIRA